MEINNFKSIAQIFIKEIYPEYKLLFVVEEATHFKCDSDKKTITFNINYILKASIEDVTTNFINIKNYVISSRRIEKEKEKED